MDDGIEIEGQTRWRLTLGIVMALAGAVTIFVLVLMLGAATKDRDTALNSQQQSYEAMILARSLDASIGSNDASNAATPMMIAAANILFFARIVIAVIRPACQ